MTLSAARLPDHWADIPIDGTRFKLVTLTTSDPEHRTVTDQFNHSVRYTALKIIKVGHTIQ